MSFPIGIKWYASVLQPNPNSNISFITKTKWEQNSTNKWEDKHNDYKVLLQTKKNLHAYSHSCAKKNVNFVNKNTECYLVIRLVC